MSPKSRSVVVLSLLITFILMLSHSAWSQDEGGQKLRDEKIGEDYLLSLWISPEPPIVGQLHITVRLIELKSEHLTTTPAITLIARAPHSDVFESAMSRVGDHYISDIDIPYSAIWTIEVLVKDSDGESRTSFPLEIQPAPINKNLVRLAAFMTLVVLGVGWWFWGRHPRKKRTRKRIFMPRPDKD